MPFGKFCVSLDKELIGCFVSLSSDMWLAQEFRLFSDLHFCGFSSDAEKGHIKWLLGYAHVRPSSTVPGLAASSASTGECRKW